MANPKSSAWYGGGLDTSLRPGANLGVVYYIDGTGPDTNNGLTPLTPLASFKAALALCTSAKNDTIVVLDYWAAGTEDWPIVVDKTMVSIIGVPLAGGPWPQVNPVGDNAGFSVTAEGVEIAGLSINGGATAGAVQIDAAVWGTEIHDCWFGEAGTCQDGIRISPTFDAVYMDLHHNRFGPGISRYGIGLLHNATRGVIRDNLFHENADVCIKVDNEFSQGWILDNTFGMLADVAGDAVTLDVTCASGVTVAGNMAHFGDTAMAQNPYLDSSAGGSNNWLLNYQGIVAVLPG